MIILKLNKNNQIAEVRNIKGVYTQPQEKGGVLLDKVVGNN